MIDLPLFNEDLAVERTGRRPGMDALVAGRIAWAPSSEPMGIRFT